MKIKYYKGYVDVTNQKILQIGTSATGFKPHLSVTQRKGRYWIIYYYHPYGEEFYLVDKEALEELKKIDDFEEALNFLENNVEDDED